VKKRNHNHSLKVSGTTGNTGLSKRTIGEVGVKRDTGSARKTKGRGTRKPGKLLLQI